MVSADTPPPKTDWNNMHLHEKFIVAAVCAAALTGQASAVELLAAGTPPAAGFPALARLVPVTAETSLSAGSGALAPAPAPVPADSFASDVDLASSDFGLVAAPAPSLGGEADDETTSLPNAGAGALPASDPKSYGLFLLGAGLIVLSGRRRKPTAPWAVTPVQLRA